jgi:hypothetical protein
MCAMLEYGHNFEFNCAINDTDNQLDATIMVY